MANLDERPPLFSSWRRAYVAVLGVLVIEVALMALVSWWYS